MLLPPRPHASMTCHDTLDLAWHASSSLVSLELEPTPRTPQAIAKMRGKSVDDLIAECSQSGNSRDKKDPVCCACDC